MKVRTVLVVLMALSFSFVGCEKKDEAADKAAADKPAPEAGEKAGDEKAGDEKAGDEKAGDEKAGDEKPAEPAADTPPTEPIPKLGYLMDQLKDCEIKGDYLDSSCEAMKAYKEHFGKLQSDRAIYKDKSEEGAKAFAELLEAKLDSPHKQVRFQAMSLLNDQVTEEVQKSLLPKIIKVASEDEEPMVSVRGIWILDGYAADDAEAGKAIIGLAKHASEAVRTAAGKVLAGEDGIKLEGAWEAAIDMLENDASKAVRKEVCGALGERYKDERVLEYFEKYTKDPVNEPELYYGCSQGAVRTWLYAIPRDEPSEKGYQLTLNLLKATPRSETQPASAILSDITWASKEDFQKNAPWFKKEDLRSALTEVALDGAVAWYQRKGLIEKLIELGADKAELEALKGKLEKAAHEDNHWVTEEIDAKLAEMK